MHFEYRVFEGKAPYHNTECEWWRETREPSEERAYAALGRERWEFVQLYHRNSIEIAVFKRQSKS